MGSIHPESPQRLAAISDRLIAAGLDVYLAHLDAPYATDEQLRRIHPERYLAYLRESAPVEGIVHLDPDTAMSAGTWNAARRAAGAGILGVDMVMRGEANHAFCAVRPPGHHAERARAMGFCFFNNIALAAAHAMAVWGVERVAIVDFDVHHGNGTEQIFSGDRRVLMVGSFQHPFYPYCGTDHPATNMCNVPLKAGTRGEGFRAAAETVWLPRLREFAPELILVSAGFDAHCEDDMASLGLVDADYAWVAQQVRDVARASAGGRVVSLLEGGYALSALGRSVAVYIKTLEDL